MRNVYVIEVTPAIDDAGTTQTFLFASEGWATLPTDTPANTLVQARLDQPGNFRRELFSGNRTIGAVRPAFGECTLLNSDGALDGFARYGFDGRPFVLRYGPVGGAYPADFTTLLKATLRGATFDMQRVRLILRDRMELLDRPLAQATYAGTGGAEGSSDVEGKRKPLAFGQLRSIRPMCINTSGLLYSAGMPPDGQWANIIYTTDGQGGNILYAYGQPDPPSTPYAADAAELIAFPVAAGYYWMCPSEGLIKLGSAPAIDMTTSVSVETSGGGTVLGGPGTILQQMATWAGITDIDSADVAAVNSARPTGSFQYGYYVEGDETALAAMSNVASGALVWFGVGADDVLHMGALESPSGTPSITLRANDITTLERLDGGDANRLIPVRRTTAYCTHNNATQSSFAGSATEQSKTWFRKEWPGEVIASNEAVKDKHLFAEEISVDVYGGSLTGSPNADGGIAAKAMTLYGVERELISVTLPLRPSQFASFEIGGIVEVALSRFGWADGKLFRVVAIDTNFATGRIMLTLWG